MIFRSGNHSRLVRWRNMAGVLYYHQFPVDDIVYRMGIPLSELQVRRIQLIIIIIKIINIPSSEDERFPSLPETNKNTNHDILYLSMCLIQIYEPGIVYLYEGVLIKYIISIEYWLDDNHPSFFLLLDSLPAFTQFRKVIKSLRSFSQIYQ